MKKINEANTKNLKTWMKRGFISKKESRLSSYKN
jgi:hypothetical protein